MVGYFGYLRLWLRCHIGEWFGRVILVVWAMFAKLVGIYNKLGMGTEVRSLEKRKSDAKEWDVLFQQF